MNPRQGHPRPHHVSARIVPLLVLGLLFSCQSVPEWGSASRSRTSAKRIDVETVFVPSDHALEGEGCLRELAGSYAQLADGVLFYERDSRLRVTPPRGPGIEPYHLHVLHRVAGNLMDTAVAAGPEGGIDLDLSRFQAPEALVVTSVSLRFLDPKSRSSASRTSASRTSARGPFSPSSFPSPSPAAAPRRDEEAIAPPYAISWRLVPADQAQLAISLQTFRYEVATERGTLSLFVQPLNRRDMLLSWVDPEKSLAPLITEDPYLHLKSSDGVIPPRLVVDVLGPDGTPWQRTGAWHLPEFLDRKAERPLAFRIRGKELISFSPPPRLDLELPGVPAATAAPIGISTGRSGEKDVLKLVLGAGYSAGPRGGPPSYRLSSYDLETRGGTQVRAIDLSDLDPSRFPLTASLLHRFVQPWRLQAGRYAPEPPRGRSEVTVGEKDAAPKLHSRILSPRHASHYDLLSFRGAGRGVSAFEDLIAAHFAGNPDGPSPNMIPPPPFLPGPEPEPGDQEAPPEGGEGRLPGGDGDESACGCGKSPKPGKPSPGCPRKKNPCRGTCGKDCPVNDHCMDEVEEEILVRFRCMKRAEGCGHDIKDCKCGDHIWKMMDAVKAVQALFPKAADISWFHLHMAGAPCHKKKRVAAIRVSHWGQGFQLVEKWFWVAVTFGPCKAKKPDGGKPGGKGDGPKKPGDPPAPPPGQAGGGPLPASDWPWTETGGSVGPQATVILGDGEPVEAAVISPGEETPASIAALASPPWNEPNLSTVVGGLAMALGLPSQSPVPTASLAYDEGIIASIAHENKMASKDLEGRVKSAYHDGAALDNPALGFKLNLLTMEDAQVRHPVAEALATPGAPVVVVPPPPPGGGSCGFLGVEFLLLSGLLGLLRKGGAP